MITYDEMMDLHGLLKDACIENAPDDISILEPEEEIRLNAIIDSDPVTEENCVRDIEFLAEFLMQWFPDMADEDYQDEIGAIMTQAAALIESFKTPAR